MQPIDHFILQRILERERRKGQRTKEEREGLRIPLPVPPPPRAPPRKKKKEDTKKPIIIDMS
jgi:hypothetical protein